MKTGKLLLTAIAAAMLTTTGALADPDHDRNGPPGWGEHHDRDGWRDHGRDHDRGRDRDDWRGREAWHWRDDRGGWHGDHDRYWRPNYRGYAERDVYFRSLRGHGYYRWDGAPYWYQGRYVVRSYDRWGRAVFVEMNPYTGGFVGVVRF